jgi:hypothetical protein
MNRFSLGIIEPRIITDALKDEPPVCETDKYSNKTLGTDKKTISMGIRGIYGL